MPFHRRAYRAGLWRHKLDGALEGPLDNIALLIFFGCALFSLLPVDWGDENTARRHVGFMMLSVMTISLYAMMR
jgi:hypothetical protein